jgi:hypothetical protein
MFQLLASDRRPTELLDAPTRPGSGELPHRPISPLESVGARVVQTDALPDEPTFTIGTLVNDVDNYRQMHQSFVAGGFAAGECEYLVVDNTGSDQTSAYDGLTRLLAAARGRYVVLCHQDVRLMADGRRELERRLDELEAHDPAWAVAGNAGGVAPGRLALRITDPHGSDRRVGTLPARVASLDENFIVVKRAASLGFSRDLTGFHLYGADICLVADVLGYSAYVIDFHLAHLSPGNKHSAAFQEAERAFHAKWSKALRSRFVQTTCALLGLSGGRFGGRVGRLLAWPLAKVVRHLPSASGWNHRVRSSGSPD